MSATPAHLAPPHRGLVLVYHRVSEPEGDPWRMAMPPASFDAHMRSLRACASPVRLEDLAGGTGLPDRPVAVTFDDGYADNLHNALPVLLRHEIPATIFIATGFIATGLNGTDGTSSRVEFWPDELERLLLHPGDLPRELVLEIAGRERRWDLGDGAAPDEEAWRGLARWKADEPPPTPRHRLYLEMGDLLKPLSGEARRRVLESLRAWSGAPPPRVSRRPMDVNELVALAQSPRVDIGAHTIDHAALSALPTDAQRREIEGSKSALQRWIDRPVRGFAYPFGGRADYTQETVALVRAAGFTYACSAFDGAVTPSTDRWQMPRLYMPDCGGERFQELIDWWFRG